MEATVEAAAGGRKGVTMSYTLTFDASHKVKRGGGHIKGFLRHVAREADDAVGVGWSYQHRNKNIVAKRTSLNQTEVSDGAGGWRPAIASAEIEAILDSRLEAVEKGLRKDAVVMRPFILQVDPDWYAEHSPNWRDGVLTPEAIKYHDEMRKWAVEEFGEKNIIATSLHLDEYAPQLHVLFTPVTDDGRLSQKDYFTGPSGMSKMHTRFREHMKSAGLDVDMRRTARSKEHLSSAEYQAKADRIREAQETIEVELAAATQVTEQAIQDLAREGQVMSDRERELDELARGVQAKAQSTQELAESVSSREVSVEAREADLRAWEAAVAHQGAKAAQDVQAAAEAREEAERQVELANRRERASEALGADLRAKQAKLDEMVVGVEKVAQKAVREVQRLEAIPPNIDRFLDRPMPGSSKTLRDLYEGGFSDVTEKRKATVEEIVTNASAVDERYSTMKGRDDHGYPGG